MLYISINIKLSFKLHICYIFKVFFKWFELSQIYTVFSLFVFYLPPIFEKRREVLFWGPSPRMFCLISQLLLKLAFFKLGMCNICKNNIAKMFLEFFKNVHLIKVFLIFGKKSSVRRISKPVWWIFTKFALQVHLGL